MQKVTSLQSGIRDIRFQLSAFNEAMNHQDEIFAELKLVRRVGSAYRTCLAEVLRTREKGYDEIVYGAGRQAR
jgi:autophagy-related protein 11